MDKTILDISIMPVNLSWEEAVVIFDLNFPTSYEI